MSAPAADVTRVRFSWKWWALACVPFLCLAIKQWDIPALATAGDYAHYLLHALALAEGRPYADIGYIYTPLNPWIGPQNQFPVWPALLAPFVWAFGPLSIAPKLLTAAALVGFSLLVARYFIRRERHACGLAVLAILPVTLERNYALSAPISDLPFAFFVWLLLWLGDAEDEWTWRRLILLSGVALLAAGTRAAGLSLFPALVVAAFFRSPAERKRVLLLGAVAGIAGVVVLFLRPESIPFLSMLTTNPMSGLSGIVRSIADYRLSVFEATTYPTTIDKVNDAFHAVVALLIVIGVPQFIRRYRRTLCFSVVVCYSMMLVVVPVRDGRYMWPLWPVIVCLIVLGLARVMELLRRPAPESRPRIVATLMLVLASAASLSAALRPRPATLIDRPATVELFAWLRSQPGHEAFRVVYESPRNMALFTGIPSLSPFRASAAATQRELDRLRITHAIFGGGVASVRLASFPDTLRALRPPWQVVFENAEYQVLTRPSNAPAVKR